MTNEMIDRADRRIGDIGQRTAAIEEALKKVVAETAGESTVDLTREDPPTTASPYPRAKTLKDLLLDDPGDQGLTVGSTTIPTPAIRKAQAELEAERREKMWAGGGKTPRKTMREMMPKTKKTRPTTKPRPPKKGSY